MAAVSICLEWYAQGVYKYGDHLKQIQIIRVCIIIYIILATAHWLTVQYYKTDKNNSKLYRSQIRVILLGYNKYYCAWDGRIDLRKLKIAINSPQVSTINIVIAENWPAA